MSRRVRVVVILALFGWAVAGVPDRVQAQRDAVAELAAERGAASAGGALLARIADLRGLGDGQEAGVWRIAPEQSCTTTVAPPATYANATLAVRARRACEAARAALAGATAAQIVEVEGDPFLVVPGAVAAVAPEASAAVAAPVAPEAPAAVAAPVTPEAPTTPTPPEAPPEPPETTGAAVAPAAPLPLADLDEQELIVLHALETLGILRPDELARILRGEADTTPSAPAVSAASATVAWWPPVQADLEARTGIPLQVGGEPPQARAILPGYRLGGVPIWSLPTPATEAAIDLLDGGTFAWLLFLGALLAREAWSYRRATAVEQDRQTTRDAILQRISHELRTPAASVRSLVDALALPDVSEAERAQFRELARGEAERLATGIDRLLQAARGAADVAIDPVPLDLAAWAEAVRARWAPRLPHLVVQATHPSPATADPERLDEAVDALLDNASKYGGPNVTLTVAPNRIVVEDDGEGIPVKDRARLVQKFERREGRVNDPGGHGLGLWAVAEVARAHRGRLVLEAGSRFVLHLGASPRGDKR